MPSAAQMLPRTPGNSLVVLRATSANANASLCCASVAFWSAGGPCSSVLPAAAAKEEVENPS